MIDGWGVPWLAILVDGSIRWGIVLSALAVWFALRPPRRAATRHLLCVSALAAASNDSWRMTCRSHSRARPPYDHCSSSPSRSPSPWASAAFASEATRPCRRTTTQRSRPPRRPCFRPAKGRLRVN